MPQVPLPMDCPAPSDIDDLSPRHSHTAEDAPDVVRAMGISKAFGGVQALWDVNLQIRTGEVHALCGENGAGKSTLIKILAGYFSPDAGRVEVAGGPAQSGISSTDDMGVAVIHQESVACLDLDAIDNVFVGREPRRAAGLLLDRAAMLRQTRELCARLGEAIDVSRPLGELPLAQRQMIGIARALSQRCRLLIMDEPTASLSARETEVLFDIIRQLRRDGVAILYVSHRIEEIFLLADRVTVLRDGRRVATRRTSELTPSRLIELMVGREIEPLGDENETPSDVDAPALLEVESLTSAGQFDNVSFKVRAGEVVGLAGLVGAGRSEVAHAIFGAGSYDSGSIRLAGAPLPERSIATSIAGRLACLPEDRQHLGLVLPMSIASNLTLSILRLLTRLGVIIRRRECDEATRWMAELRIPPGRMRLPAETLSGGNQQKLVLGKWLATRPKVLILDEPTRGVDVAAKAEIHRSIRQLARGGMATLVISSELPEILRLCDRVIVMREGRVAGELNRREATEQRILELALPLGASLRDARRLAAANLRPRSARSRFWQRREVWLLATLFLALSVVGLVKPSFLAPRNLLDIAADAAPIAIMACAVTLVIIAGEIDISVGSLLGLSAAVLGLLCYGENPPMSVPWAIVCALAVGLGVGALNGLLVTLGGVPSIIATLGMLTVLRGLTKLIMQGNNIYGRPESLREFATGSILTIPNSIWVAGCIAVAAAMLADRTPLGRRIYAVGSNPKAAPLLGISVGLTRFVAFAISGLCAGVAAVVLAPKNSLIQPNMGESLELLVVTCVVVGGTSIRGGRGTITGTLLAVLLLSLVPTALTYVGAPPEWRLAIQGGFILAAVLFDTLTRPRQFAGVATP